MDDKDRLSRFCYRFARVSNGLVPGFEARMGQERLPGRVVFRGAVGGKGYFGQ